MSTSIIIRQTMQKSLSYLIFDSLKFWLLGVKTGPYLGVELENSSKHQWHTTGGKYYLVSGTPLHTSNAKSPLTADAIMSR